MASADVDTGFLATHLGLPEPTLSSALSNPTVDLIKSVLQAVAAKAHEFNELSSERLRQDIELESAVRSSEARTQSFKSTAEKALKDVEEVRQKLKTEGASFYP
jgi:nucleoprotein TPR